MLELLHQTCLQRMQQLPLRVLLLLCSGFSRCFLSLLLLQKALAFTFDACQLKS